MANKDLLKLGNSIPVEEFHVSPLNVRFGKPFGGSEEDQLLIANLRKGKIIGPFKARPEEDSYGVVVGRRRFLAKKEAGARQFVVGVDCLIEEMTDDEAREMSLIENLEALRARNSMVLPLPENPSTEATFSSSRFFIAFSQKKKEKRGMIRCAGRQAVIQRSLLALN